jgi:hypothetical protein
LARSSGDLRLIGVASKDSAVADVFRDAGDQSDLSDRDRLDLRQCEINSLLQCDTRFR